MGHKCHRDLARGAWLRGLSSSPGRVLVGAELTWRLTGAGGATAERAAGGEPLFLTTWAPWCAASPQSKWSQRQPGTDHTLWTSLASLILSLPPFKERSNEEFVDMYLTHYCSLTHTDPFVQPDHSGIWETSLSPQVRPILPLKKSRVCKAGGKGKGTLGRQLGRDFVCNGILGNVIK